MITDTDLQISNESYTSKDFYQLYPEILDLVKKISASWDPAASNESDPGVVLLKCLAFMGDKLNYNQDKKMLENYPVSITQEDSMKKICEEMGYTMQYIKSATTTVTFMYTGEELPLENETAFEGNPHVVLPAFTTVLTNENADITYITTQAVDLKYRYKEVTVPIIEGTFVSLEVNDDNILRASNLDDNNRYYLPESGIAQNGIWIADAETAAQWERVDNLNVNHYEENSAGEAKILYTVWKFGYDSSLGKPYIQFPDNVVELIGRGLSVSYMRSSGASGNISATTLSKLSDDTVTVTYDSSSDLTDTEVSSSNITVQNSYSTINGADKETIDDAYNGFKKTVGTFDTLIACRDYANKIYQMVVSETVDDSPLVSNCQVSDIRNELNTANTIVSYDDYGLTYKATSEKTDTNIDAYVSGNQSTAQTETITIGDSQFNIDDVIQALVGQKITVTGAGDKITAFDLYIYPLNAITTSYSKETYQNSFKPNTSNVYEIKNQLADLKCIAHNIKQVDTNEETDLYLIKNYYKISARISCKYKLSNYEVKDVKSNIYLALFKNFNARQLDYGEAIPTDTLVSVIENADERIKRVDLNNIDIYTKAMMANGKEYLLTNDSTKLESITDETTKAKCKDLYKRLIAKNVLAGRAPLLRYNEELNVNYNMLGLDAYNGTYDSDKYNGIYGNENNYFDSTPSPNNKPTKDNSITAISTDLKLNVKEIKGNNNTYTLRANEVIQLCSPKLNTVKTYPMYVNYYFHRGASSSVTESIPCKLREFDCRLVQDYNNYFGNESKEIISVFSDFKHTETKTEYIARCGGSVVGKAMWDLRTNSLTKLMQILVNNGYNIYRQSKTNDLSITPGSLIDSDGYTYKLLGGRSAANFYQTTSIEYNEDYYYYTDTPIASENNLIDDPVSKNPQNVEYVKITTLYYNSQESYKTCATITPEEAIKISGYTLEQINAFKQTNGERLFYNKIEDLDSTGEITKIKTECYQITYTTGQNIDYSYIPADSEYYLQTGDILYINLTDSNDVVKNYRYYIESGEPVVELNGIALDTSLDENKSEAFSGIINVNFDLYDSAIYHSMGTGHNYAKTSGYSEDWDIPGMFSLGTTDEIGTRAFAKASMKSSAYLYWITNNNNTIQFIHDPSSDESGDYKTYSYILDENEYLFYTNATKNYLYTLGQGTKLIYRTNSQNAADLIWKLNKSDIITTSNIAENGIGAFAQSDWIQKTFSTSVYLTTQKMNFIQLGEDDTIENLILEDTSLEYIDSTQWYKLKLATKDTECLSYNNTKLNYAVSEDASSDYYWSIRPILKLNVGPDLTQSLLDDDFSQHRVKLYTSAYYENGDIVYNEYIVEELTNNYDNLTERIIYDSDIDYSLNEELDGFIGNEIRSNYLIQKNGGQLVSYHTSDINGQITDDLIIYPFAEKTTTEAYWYKKASTEGEEPQKYALDTSNGIDLSKLANSTSTISRGAHLSIYIPVNHLMIITMYLTITGTDKVILKAITDSTEEGADKTINFYSELPWESTSEWKNQLTLNSGLNVIVVKNPIKYIQIDSSSDETQGKLSILDPKLIITKKYNETIECPSGINYSYLGLDVDETSDFVKDYIKAKDTDNIFYYSVPISNSNLLDVDTLDDYNSWINVNNVCSKFVLSEIDVSALTGIEVASGSKVN